MVKNKTILVIGGAGTLGKVIVSKLVNLSPKKIIVMSRDEEKHYWMKQELPEVTYRIGDIRNYSDVCSVVKDADIVINCAAMKQVPVCEDNIIPAVQTNIIGLSNIIQAISDHSYPVDTVVQISSDKVCDSYSVMGMTKAIQERLAVAANKVVPGTRFICLRCANFRTSNGSVTELFTKQIASGGPVTVTHEDMTRYFVYPEDVYDMFISALEHANPGEIYISPGTKFKIIDIAKQLIGYRDIKIKFIGIRPGEKLDEVLISDNERHRCITRNGYAIIPPNA